MVYAVAVSALFTDIIINHDTYIFSHAVNMLQLEICPSV